MNQKIQKFNLVKDFFKDYKLKNFIFVFMYPF